MATAPSQGIMDIPMQDAAAQPQLGLDDSYDAIQQGLQNASPDAHAAVNDELGKLAPALDQLPDETLDQLLQLIQYMHDNPKEYAQCLKELIDAGIISEGDFPEEYDPEFLATMGMVIMQARKTRQGAQGAAPVQQAPVPPANMARGGIAEAAHIVASKGRGQDTMLAHITPKEAKMLRSKGGMGTINPTTGLPEYGLFKFISNVLKGAGDAVSSAVKSIGKTVKSIISSPVGRILATVALAAFIGPGAFGLSGAAGVAAQMALASGAVTALGGGNIRDVLKSAAIGGATAFFGAPGGAISNFVGGAVTNAAANAAITSGIVGTGIGLLSGQKLQDAVKSGLTAGAISGLTTGATKGFDAQIQSPQAPTVADQLKQDQPASPKIETSPLSPETNNYMQPAGADGRIAVLGPNQNLMTNPDGSLRVEQFNGRPSYMIDNGDGSITFKTVPFADRGISSVEAPTVQSQGTSTVAPPSTADFLAQHGGSEWANMPPSTAAFASAEGPMGPPAPAGLGENFVGPPTPVSSDAYKPPTFSRAYDELGQGQYGKAAQTVFMPEAPTADQVHDSAAFKNARNAGADYNTAYQKASEQMGAPGLIRTYGPATAAGLGIAGLAGAFTPTKPQPSPEQQAMSARLQAERDRVAANPGAYAPQGMERFGIQYNDRGEIIGSQPWNPQPLGPTEVAGNYMTYKPSPYMSPTGGIGNPMVAQPYNTANMYDFFPRHAADGGMMAMFPSEPVMRDMGGIASLASGGYPRRTGQIAGPGTETSDSIPAMLSDGEFVMTAKAVRGAGKGNRLAGAKKMYALMHQLERNAARG